jgi:hypothetical protein
MNLTRYTPAFKEEAVRKMLTRGKGSWRDNVFVERVWCSLKYEEVYLKAYESVSHTRRSIGQYIDLYGTQFEKLYDYRICNPCRTSLRAAYYFRS